MRINYLFLSVFILIVILSSGRQAYSQVPRSFSIQGVITDSGSKTIPDGVYTITLRLYDKLIGGNIVYSEEYTTPVFKGLFNLTLGAKSPLPPSIVFDKQYFVGISYNGNSEIARIPFSSVPYSIMAETVPDGSITSNKIADGSITLDKLSPELRNDKKGSTTLANSATGALAFIGGGDFNVASGNYSSIVGGYSNKAQANYSIAAGGNSNIASSVYTTVSGGYSNVASAQSAAIGGGSNNIANGPYSMVGGGSTNKSQNQYSGVSSGLSNTSSSSYSYIGGGSSNTAGGNYSGILGGYSNYISGMYGSIVGGYDNAVTGDYSVVVGGNGLTLNGDADRTFGFLANSGSRSMTINTPKVAVFGNTDLWIASNDGTARALKLFSNNMNASGAYPSTVSKNVAIKAPDSLLSDYTLILPINSGSTGQVLTTNGSGELSWSAAGASGSAGGDLTGTYPNPQIASGVIINSDINASAAIDYSKLNLAGSIVNADVSSTAAIAYSKLDLSSSIVNADVSGTAAIAYSKLNLTSSIVNADVSGTAAIAYSKLNLTSSIVNADVSGTAAIAYSKLDLSNSIVNADVSGTAAIAYSKLNLSSSIVNADVSPTAAIAYSKLNLTNSIVTGDLTSGSVVTATLGDSSVTSLKIEDGTIVNADVSPTAAIAYSKLALSNSIVSGDLTTNAVTTGAITDSAVTGSKILTGAVETGHLANNSVNGAKIAMGSDATGDIMYYDGTDYVRLPAGSNTNVLTLASGIPSWAAASGGTVTTNSTLTGNGTGGSPLGINLGNSNTWTANQTFSGTFLITANARIAMTNSDNNSRDLRIQEPSGTGSQYIGIRCPSVTNNGNYLWPSAVGSVGQAMIISSTNGVDSANLSWGTFLASGSSAGGDLTGTYPNPTIADNAVTGAKIAMGSDATGDIMYYNGTDYTRRAIGSTGDVLTVSGGVPTWAPPSGGGGGGLAVDLLATKTSAQSLPNGGSGVTPDDLLFDNVVTSPTVGSYNSGTSVYTAGSTGLYMITVNVTSSTATVASAPVPQLVVNGTTVVYGVGVSSTNFQTNFAHRGELTTVVSLTAGDLVKIKCANQNTTNTTAISTDATTRISIMKF
ncbi:MAG: hypothetical protein HYZ54_03640 [Ignavibacteriae bacterium]|nr:hypothetical protein [Ignavibacteriota bacterium]